MAAAHAALTTSPVTTVRNDALALADTIDTVIAAEDIPARIQVAGAASGLAHASAREIGHVMGSVAGNVALTVAPGAAINKLAALRRLRLAPPRPTFPPFQVEWVKERVNSDKPWKIYNDTAPGARPDLAPALTRTMADGSKRRVKFDGVQGDYLVDHKWAVTTRPHATAQLLRQNDVLAQHRLIGLWEVPTPKQKTIALRQFKKKNVTNIHVKVVKP
ncbi:hypothetical protein GCM10011380_10740 [Sphingomonas metalli]|uniref:Uncharacterized protein n=1 Tax=Sphingomonas metalli TaxID=1779358 RepID=A0A916T0G4_9SPHN|nr:hypothetical protein GCM10011380_10740 [Sphingomonas metalli]